MDEGITSGGEKERSDEGTCIWWREIEIGVLTESSLGGCGRSREDQEEGGAQGAV